jgi:hypothetical protein
VAEQDHSGRLLELQEAHLEISFDELQRLALDAKRSTKCNVSALHDYAEYSETLLAAKTRAFPPNIQICFPGMLKALRSLNPDQFDALRDW